jgi:hypothetical protein
MINRKLGRARCGIQVEATAERHTSGAGDRERGGDRATLS